MAQARLAATLRGDRSNTWEAIGPKNIGGRTLCLAVNPVDTNILWAGSASGGLWKSTTAGIGATAWERVETGFPVLGVSSIAINPANPNEMYIGTGEVYNYENSMPNVAIRTTRGTYGIGILKSTDGGQTWFKSLDWSYGDLRGVQDVVINPLRPATVYAATTEGLMRSYNSGASWHVAHDRKMAVDVDFSPADTSVILVSHGSHNDQTLSGIFRSTNGGQTFTKLSAGLPAAYSGKALLAFAPSNPAIIYASIGNLENQEGLYRTINGGNTWVKINSTNVSSYQGWYSHDISVHSQDPNQFLWVGIDTWKSTDGGLNAFQQSLWYAWYFGYVPAGGPEGPPNYVHADIHGVYFMQDRPDKAYLVTDGGIFVTYDAGETFEGRNGGYQTQQFYANVGNGTGDNFDWCIGGMQDNSTAIYKGDPSWYRVLGGDGECAAIDPEDNNIMYGSSQYLNMYRSDDGGSNWTGITSGEISIEEAAFNGPFEIAPSDPNVLYAGAQSLFRSDDRGDNWANLTGGPVTPEGDIILTIAPSPHNVNRVLFSTAPLNSDKARVMVFDLDEGQTIETNMPDNRICMDLAWHPNDPNIAYAVLAGFNTQHVWKSTDRGLTWNPIGVGLPDVPTNSIVLDPLHPADIYVGNDLGVWRSPDGGDTWTPYSIEAPQAMLSMHLSITAHRKLRVATWSLGVWQTDLAYVSGASSPAAPTLSLQQIRPNPASERIEVVFSTPKQERIRLKVLNMQGAVVAEWPFETVPPGEHSRTLPIGDLPAGTYGLSIENSKGKPTGKLFVKN